MKLFPFSNLGIYNYELYFQVKSNCPDFKSHFKNIERSLVVNLWNINVNVHRTALLKLQEYWNNLQT